VISRTKRTIRSRSPRWWSGCAAKGVLRNPPIVTRWPPTPRGSWVLDGANRHTAARWPGLPHLVVQVVRYEDPGLKLTTWHQCRDRAGRRPSSSGAAAPLPSRFGSRRAAQHARAVLARREAAGVRGVPGGRR